ncbi:hypothetical protein HaLaN_13734 [Haematococcus lacustris]|uniref:Uncharacterized protein n=2 Tax=Haematococcus lacustris TaxID=44745 RepID=A0A699ZE54_HAELA|nr:hypothetical protein HaLaN_13734 [Haematococcus lacustris]
MLHCAGFMYVQNAAPDGPATWAFRFIGEITTRMMDDVPFMMSLGKMPSERDHLCLTFDQAFPVGDKIRFAHPLPRDAYRAKLAQLHLPNMDYPWAEALGGRLLPNDTGTFTQAFLAQLRDDCPSCPWWNEHRPLLPGGDMKGDITPNM